MNNYETHVIEHTSDHYEWTIDRLVEVHGESPNVDYIRKARKDLLALRGLIDSSKADALPVSSSQAPASPKSEEVFNSKKITLEIEDRPTGKVVHWKVDERPDRNFDVTISGHVVGVSKVVDGEWVFTPSGPKSAPRVKELVWKQDAGNQWYSDSRIGLYMASNGCQASFAQKFFEQCSSNDEAKAACQEDYTRRILSALEEEL